MKDDSDAEYKKLVDDIKAKFKQLDEPTQKYLHAKRVLNTILKSKYVMSWHLILMF